MQIPIEDNFDDVLTKAAAGQGLGYGAMAVRSNLSMKELKSLFAGDFDERHARQVAPVLNLDADKLVSMAQGAWVPEPISVAGLKCFNTEFPQAGYPGASVNSFVVFDSASSKAIAFDTGIEAEGMLSFLKAQGLTLEALFLTHTHRDHVAAYAPLLQQTGCSVSYAPALEPYEDATLVEAGHVFRIGSLTVEARLTNGHSRGGMTYVVDGLERQLAIVGDALFCLSQGGTKQGYRIALKNNREQILSLSGDTVICPGHGPMTTVANELAHNPFY